MLRKAHLFIAVFVAGFTMLFVIVFMYALGKRNRSLRRLWCKFTMWLVGIKDIEILGEIDLSAKLFTINHRTLLDIIVIEGVLPNQIDPCWIAKKEIAKIPIYGRILDAPKMITIDRENSREIIKLLKTVDEPLAIGRPLMIFPEGTRNKGNGLLKFKSGAKILGEKKNLPVQPVVIHYDPFQLSIKNGINFKKVYIEFLPTVQPDNDWYTKLEADMNQSYTKIKSRDLYIAR